MTTETTHVAIHTLGGFRLVSGDQVVEVDDVGGPRAAALLLRLALDANTPVPREELAQVMWDGNPPSTWFASLRNTMSSLRRSIATIPAVDIAVAGEGRILTVTQTLAVDLLEIEEACRRAAAADRNGEHRRVLEISERWLGAAAATVLPEYQNAWVETLRQRVAAARTTLLGLAVRAALGAGDPAYAETLAREIVTLEPLNEHGHQLLMRALDAGGNRASALRLYESVRKQLRDELGINPSRETQDLFLELLRHDEAGVWREARRHRPFAASRLMLQEQAARLVARTEDLAAVDAALARALSGEPQLVIASGPAGIGKTRLAAAVATSADRRGALVLYGRADNRIPYPYGPVVEALNSYLALLRPQEVLEIAGRHRGVLARLLPAVRAVADADPPTGTLHLDRLHAIQAFHHVVSELSQQHGLLLVLDDLHWAGDSVTEFLRSLCGQQTPDRVLVLALHRDGAALAEDLEDASGRLTRIELAPLTRAQVAELVEQPGLHKLQRLAVADEVWSRTGGNPFLVKVMLEAGGLTEPHERDVLDWKRLLAGRVADLAQDGAPILSTAAVSGQEFDPSVILRAAAFDFTTGEHLLASAQEAGILESALTHPGWLSFSHAMIRDNVLEQLGDEEEAALHSRIADVLADTVEVAASGDATSGALAYHLSASGRPGDWQRAVTYALPVMGAALVAGEFDDAVALGLRTLGLLEQAGDPEPRSRWRLQILLGAAWRALGDNRAHSTLHQVVDETREAGEHRLMADAALALVDRVTGTAEAYVDADLIPLCQEVLAVLPEEDLARRVRLLGHLATANAWVLDGATAARLGREALELAEVVGDPVTSISVLTATRQSMAGSARVEDMEHAEHELLRHADAVEDPIARFRASIWRFETLIQQGRGAELEEWLDRAKLELPVLRDTRSQHQYLYSLAACAHLRGDIDAADRLVEEAAAVGAANPAAVPMVEGIKLIQLMGVRQEQGRLAELRNDMVAFATMSGIPEWMGIVAFADAELGRMEDVRPHITTYFDSFDRSGPTMAAPIGLAAQLAPAIRAIGDVPRAHSLYATLLPHRGLGCFFGYFGGPFDYALALLADTVGDRDLAADHLREAVRFSTELGAPLWAERCAAALG